MKKTTFLTVLQIIFTCLFAAAQQSKAIRYFNTENVEISEKQFKNLRSTNQVLDIPGDSLHHKKLIKREEGGTISDRNKLLSLLEKASETTIDTNAAIVIIYYPGQDPCNSSGSSNNLSERYKQTEKLSNQITTTKTFYIYKDNKGLEESKYSNINWIKDPEQLIEQTFFKYHYPCGSFTVISKTGKYKSYFGEYIESYILDAVQALNK